MVLESQSKTRQQMLDMFIRSDDDYVYRLPETSTNIFYGRFGGLSVLRSVQTTSAQRLHSTQILTPGQQMVEAFETTSLPPPTGFEPRFYTLLPKKQQVVDLTKYALETALVFHQCLDLTQYLSSLDRIFEIAEEDYSPDDKGFLTLVYSVIALGSRCLPSTGEDEIDDDSDKVKFKG